MREIIKMIVVLTVICGISGFALSFLKQSTAAQIELQLLTYVQGPSLKLVFADYDNDPLKDRKKFAHPETGKPINVFPAIKDGKLIAVAIEDFGGGYGDDIGVMVGFDMENDVLTGIGITTMKETPGLGTRVAEWNFRKQFVSQVLPVDTKSNGGEIDTISGATISSVGTVVAVKNASKVYKSLKGELAGAWK